ASPEGHRGAAPVLRGVDPRPAYAGAFGAPLGTDGQEAPGRRPISDRVGRTSGYWRARPLGRGTRRRRYQPAARRGGGGNLAHRPAGSPRPGGAGRRAAGTGGNGTARYGTARHGTARHGTVGPGRREPC